jgi:electron-transferring-flavoprotein dehydrogenase
VPRIKGSHTAMKIRHAGGGSGRRGDRGRPRRDELAEYDAAVRDSWIAKS